MICLRTEVLLSAMATGQASVRMRTGSCQFTSVLASAASEWLLIILLFFQAFFSYLVTKFASYCKLQTPCLICSRLDHLFSRKKSVCYGDLICSGHKFEISSLVFCQIHEKLVDARTTCQNCLNSFFPENDIQSDLNKPLVQKFNQDIEFRVEDGLLVADNTVICLPTKKCSCCNDPYMGKGRIHKSVQTQLINRKNGEAGVSLSSMLPDNHVPRREILKKRGSPSGSYVEGPRSFDPLAHIGYTELKITSESESEFPISDDDEGIADFHELKEYKEVSLAQQAEIEPDTSHLNILPEALSTDLAGEKLIHLDSVPESPILVSHELHHSHGVETDDFMASPSNIVTGHGLEELNWHQVTGESAPSLVSSLETPVEVSKKDLTTEEIVGITCQTSSKSTEFIDAAPCSSFNDSGSKVKRTAIDSSLSTFGSMDMNDVYKLAIGDSGRYPLSAEPLAGRDTSRIHEDLKLLLSQISATRGFDLSWTDMSPRVQRHVDDSRNSGTSSSMIQPSLPKKLSIERNESGFESLDGSIISEIEGESEVDRLKRQILRDRQAMSSLYRELEEERNAAAISANQAMAMINRLQEEKAAIEMEALQYQRMMEEQAEYDQEALQKANDTLSEREKELQDLESEVESYRMRFENESVEEKILETMSNYHENDKLSSKSHLVQKPEDRNEDYEGDKGDILNSDFVDERSYIVRRLRELERKLCLFSNQGVCVGDFGSEETRDESARKVNLSGYSERQNLVEGYIDKNGEDLTVDNMKEKNEMQLFGSDDIKVILSLNNGNHSSELMHSDLVALHNEVSHLNDRIQTLEADREFLEHTMNSLKNGDEGIQFVQEIAVQLRELRRVGMTRETATT